MSSRLVMDFSIDATSKTPPDIQYFLAQGSERIGELFDHVFLLGIGGEPDAGVEPEAKGIIPWDGLGPARRFFAIYCS